MSSDFLFELGTEELPPKALLGLSETLTSGILKGFESARLSFGEVSSFAAPRRLALLVRDLAVKAPDNEVVNWGPPTKVAFDSKGSPTKAAQAFAMKNNLALTELLNNIDHDGKQEKLCVRKTEEGKATASLLSDLINASLSGLPIAKRMSWGNGKELFVRPVQWAVLLFDGQTCEESILGITSSNVSRGHRFHGSGDITIDSPLSYEQQLKEQFVIASFDDRRNIIREGVASLEKTISGRAVIDDALLDEVSALNEWPVPLMGHFDRHFLEVPSEALISSMKEHQKYFHLIDDNDHLLPAFITVANIKSNDPSQVVAGNERVIRPRLADAAFFYENDRLVSLEQRRESLKKVVFQDKLGSVFDKTARVANLCSLLAPFTGADAKLTRRAGELCKSDLVTDMVGEFADLQGVMGRYYALHDGEQPDIAEALLEQYLPRFSGDKVPTTAVGATLALADKLDTLVGIFSIGQPPSGSRDPFALRRASLGILRIILDGKINIDLSEAISLAAKNFNLDASSLDKTRKQVLTYVLERHRSWYRDEGFSAAVFLSVSTLGVSNPLDIDARIKAVAQFCLLPEASALSSANKRVSNILAKQLSTRMPEPLNKALLKESAEKALARSIMALEGSSKPLLASRDYNTLLQNLASLHGPVDQFFEEVMVVSDDAALRENRLSLLKRLRDLFLNVADISQLAPGK
ncbi:MAG: glycine--tRNA ligase subunit beta [Porticoccaceae bacterium]|nr:glycine--tRNA ligase subunit beta [Porticoccaceae bacterium]